MDPGGPPEGLRLDLRERLLAGDSGPSGFVRAADAARAKLSELKGYILSVEDLIDEREQYEVDGLEAIAANLSERGREEFWAGHYPEYWDQLVRMQFRASATITIIAFVESSLINVASDVRQVVREHLKPNELRGGPIERSRLYIERFGKFERPSQDVGEQLLRILDIRNLLVHASGRVSDYHEKKQGRVRSAIAQSIGIEEKFNGVIIRREYLNHALDVVEKYICHLVEEMNRLCERTRKFEQKSST